MPAPVRNPIPNPNNNHDVALIGVTVALVLLALVGLVSRILTRKMKQSPLHLDDYLLMLAFVRACPRELSILVAYALGTLCGRGRTRYMG